MPPLRSEDGPANPNLTQCWDCGREVSKRAESCPHCGAILVRRKKHGVFFYVFWGVISLIAAGLILGIGVAVFQGAGEALSGTGNQGWGMSRAESSLRDGHYARAVEMLNRIASESPASVEGRTVLYLRQFLREKTPANQGPLTEDEGRRLAELLVLYEKTGTGKGLGDLADAAANLHQAREDARREIIDEQTRKQKEQ